jgi:hypothetical protein
LRQSAGQDVDAGCGQLRARAVAVPGEARVAFHKTRLASERVQSVYSVEELGLRTSFGAVLPLK